MRITRANPHGRAAPAAVAAIAAMALALGPALPVAAQTTGAQQANPPQPPRVIVVPNDIYRGPPAPPERQIAPPRSSQEISPAMPRPEALPQMTPRVGN